MSARDFVNDTLLPWLESEMAEKVEGNKSYLTGFEDAVRGMTRFIEEHRNRWDIE